MSGISKKLLQAAGVDVPAPELSASVLFDNSSWLSLSGTPLQFTGSDTLTVEFWVYKTQDQSTTDSVLTITASETDPRWSFFWRGAAQGFAVFNGTQSTYLNGPQLALDAWHHCAFVKEGSETRLYSNGTLAATGTSTVSASGSITGIGAQGNTGAEAFPGYISNVRVVKGTALYTANFTPPTSELTAISGTSLLTCQAPDPFADNSPNAFTITQNGNPVATGFSPFDGGWNGWTSNWSGVSGSTYLTATAQSYGTGLGGSYQNVFSNDGLTYFNAGRNGVREHILTTPYDLSTATLNYTYNDADANSGYHSSTFFSPDGRQAVIFIAGPFISLSLSTPWRLSTFNNRKLLANQFASFTGGTWMHPGGGRIFVAMRYTGFENVIRELSLTPGDATTISFVRDVALGSTTWFNINFSGDGLTAYLATRASRTIHTYSLTTPYDLATATFVNESPAFIHNIFGIDFTNNGQTMWVGVGSESSGDVTRLTL